MLRVGDLRGLAERPRLRIGDRTLTLLEPDEIPDSLGGNVLVARLPDDLTGPFTVSVELNLNGSRSLAALPLAKETRMMVRGDWPHPGFTGLLLPAEREVGDDGFMGAGTPTVWRRPAPSAAPVTMLCARTVRRRCGWNWCSRSPVCCPASGR